MDLKNITVHLDKILKSIIIVIPILIVLIGSYLSIMTKLTQLEEKIINENTKFDYINSQLKSINDQEISLQRQLNEHIAGSKTLSK
jgi:hypothetical protein